MMYFSIQCQKIFVFIANIFVSDIKQVCQSVTKIIHSKWLMINGREEVVYEGQGHHTCYRVYKHDDEYTEGENIWIKYSKFKLVPESIFVVTLDGPSQ